MKTCSNCGKTWDDDALHCAECGAALPTTEPEETNAPADETPDTVQNQPDEVSEQIEEKVTEEAGEAPVPLEFQSEPEKKKSPLRIILPIIAAVLIIAVIVGIFFLRNKGGTEEETKVPKNYSVYVKDNDLFFMDDKREKPVCYGENVFKDPDDHDFVFYYNTNSFNDDASKFFYAVNIDTEDDTYTLFYRETKKEDSPAFKIAEDVKAYLVLHKDAGVLYANSDGSIYLHDFTERTKIVSETEDYRFSSDQKRIAYLTEDGSLYVQEINADKIKIDSDVDDLSYASKDLKTMVYLKDGTLYRKEGEEDRQKIDTDVNKVVAVYDSGEVYYTKLDKDKSEDKPTLYDYVTEPKDQPDKDDEILDKESGRTENSAILLRDAKIRIWTREALQEIELDIDPVMSLYCYDGTETTMMSKTYSDIYDRADNAPVLAVKCYDNIKIKKLSLTEIIDALDKEEHFIKTWDNGGTIYKSGFKGLDYYDTYKKVILSTIEDGAVDYIITGSTATALDGKAEDYYINKDGTEVMFVSDAEDNVGTLRQIRIENNAVQPAEEYDTEVCADSAWGFTNSGKFLYYKNKNKDKAIFDLYLDKTLVDYDVHSVFVKQDGALILYSTDYNTDEGCYTLNRFADGEKSKVAENVDRYEVWDNGTILYLCNPSSSKKYDLCMFKDGVNSSLDFDVVQFLDNTLPTSYGMFTFRWTSND